MGKMITASMMKKFMLHPSVSLYSYFKYSSLDLQMATYDEMVSGDGLFNMIETHPDNVIGLFDMMIDGEESITVKAQLGNLRQICIDYSNPQPEPTPEPTPITPTCKSTQWQRGQDVVIELLEPLTETASVTTWLVKEGFADENMGRAQHVKDALKYTIRLADKRGEGNIEVRVNCENALFNLEVI